MAAATAPLPNQPQAAGFWARFVSEVRRRVGDVNVVAEEELWAVNLGAEPEPWVAISAAAPVGCNVHCAFDARRGVVVTGCGALPEWDRVLPWAHAGRRVILDDAELAPGAVAARLLDDLARASEL